MKDFVVPTINLALLVYKAVGRGAWADLYSALAKHGAIPADQEPK